MTKTLVDIDETLLGRARTLSGIRTKKDVVATALEQFVRRLELAEYTAFVESGALDDLNDPAVIASAQR